MIFTISILFSLLLSLAILYQIYREIKSRNLHVKDNYEPYASVIIPVRGIDINIENNIKSLLNQDYNKYELIFVVDSWEDPIVNILNKFNLKIFLNKFNCNKCSGKISAQMTGLMHSNGEVIVFADSDTFYPKDWLRNMILPLKNFTASTVFSWPLPYRISLRNLLRAGFWTLGFESQAIGGTFLWGGSMAFRKEFFTKEVISELSKEICDDCTLTRIIKEKGGKIAFVWKAMPINIYDEKELIKWSSREVLMIIKHSKRGAKIFIVFSFLFISNIVLSILSLNFLFISNIVLWIIKNLIRGFRWGKKAILPSLFSVIAIFFGLIILLYNWRRNYIEWRGRIYKFD
jgi:cellulose synthase/poly-beta-1,6-N-acetylglucosamine synthase-like glycosyltransferase